jgi:DNA-binding MarR family transcriptional regulator
MSTGLPWEALGLPADEAEQLGDDAATRVRIFRLIIVLAQELRTRMDQRLKPDGLTTQQAALITAVDAMGAPSLSQAAAALGTSHQNARQIADALERKGMLRISPDARDTRVRRLQTTDQSREYWRQRSRSDQLMVLEWFQCLTEEEAGTLFRLMLRVEGHLRTGSITGQSGEESPEPSGTETKDAR